MSKRYKKGVSVIICTYNGGTVIAETLRSLGNQKIHDSISWEIILVDNASTDHTSEMAERNWNEGNYEIPLKIIYQPIPGVTASRIKGIEAATYEYILTCDDDNRLSENYISTAFKIMEDNPGIGILGGRGVPEFECSPPEWFYQYQQYYACGDQYEREGDLSYTKGYVYGAGCVYRKSVWESLRECGFKIATPGRDKGKMVGSEDNLLGYIHVVAGYKIWYSKELVFNHFIKANKLTFRYLKKMNYGNGSASTILDPFVDYVRGQIHSSNRYKEVYRTIRYIISICKKCILGKFIKNYSDSCMLEFSYYLGRVNKLFDITFNYAQNYVWGLSICREVEKLKR